MFFPDLSFNSGFENLLAFQESMIVPFFDVLSDHSFSSSFNPFYDSFQPQFQANYNPIDYFSITFGKHFPLIEFHKSQFEILEHKNPITTKHDKRQSITKMHSKKEVLKEKNLNLIHDKKSQSSISVADKSSELFNGSYFPSINLIKENWIKIKPNKEKNMEIKPLLNVPPCEDWFEPSLKLNPNQLLPSNKGKNQRDHINVNSTIKSPSGISEKQSHNSNQSFSSIENQSNLDFNLCSNLVEKLFDEQNERYRFEDCLSSSKNSLDNSYLSQNINQESIKL